VQDVPTLGGASFMNDALHFVQHILWPYMRPLPRCSPRASGISYFLWTIAGFVHLIKKVPIAHIFSLPNAKLSGLRAFCAAPLERWVRRI